MLINGLRKFNNRTADRANRCRPGVEDMPVDAADKMGHRCAFRDRILRGYAIVHRNSETSIPALARRLRQIAWQNPGLDNFLSFGFVAVGHLLFQLSELRC